MMLSLGKAGARLWVALSLVLVGCGGTAILDDGSGGVIAQCEWGNDVAAANIEAVFAAWLEPLASLRHADSMAPPGSPDATTSTK